MPRRGAGRVGSDMQLVHDHVGKVRRHKSRVVPGIGCPGTDEATAGRERSVRRHFSRIGIAFVTARPRAHDPKMIRVAVPGIGNEARPVSIGILRHQQIVGLAGLRRASKGAVDVDRSRPGRPGAKRRSAAVNEICPHGSCGQDIGLRNHGTSSLRSEVGFEIVRGPKFGTWILYPVLVKDG